MMIRASTIAEAFCVAVGDWIVHEVDRDRGQEVDTSAAHPDIVGDEGAGRGEQKAENCRNKCEKNLFHGSKKDLSCDLITA